MKNSGNTIWQKRKIASSLISLAGTIRSYPPLTDDERRLAVYVDTEKSVRNYVASLKACKTSAEVGQVVATMCENESRIDEERIVTKAFIEVLLPFMTGVESGKGIDNIRNYINNAWAERKRALRNR